MKTKMRLKSNKTITGDHWRVSARISHNVMSCDCVPLKWMNMWFHHVVAQRCPVRWGESGIASLPLLNDMTWNHRTSHGIGSIIPRWKGVTCCNWPHNMCHVNTSKCLQQFRVSHAPLCHVADNASLKGHYPKWESMVQKSIQAHSIKTVTWQDICWCDCEDAPAGSVVKDNVVPGSIRLVRAK